MNRKGKLETVSLFYWINSHAPISFLCMTLNVLGYACSASEFFKVSKDIQPDIILVDVSMPEMSGIELTRLIKEQSPQARILALTMYEDYDSYNKNKLSKREIQIVSLIAREFSTHGIAQKLYISELTVEAHRKNIMAKTNAKSIVGLVKYAIREGIVYY